MSTKQLSGINADTISELTSGAGVTAGSVKLKSGEIYLSQTTGPKAIYQSTGRKLLELWSASSGDTTFIEITTGTTRADIQAYSDTTSDVDLYLGTNGSGKVYVNNGVEGYTDETVALSYTQTLTNKRITQRINSTASSATPAINVNTTDQFNITALATNITSMTSGLTGTPTNGQKLMIRIKGAASQTITWGTSFVSSGTATLLASTAAGKTHMIGLIYDSTAAKWVCMAVDATGY